jgi:hypothetical protein
MTARVPSHTASGQGTAYQCVSSGKADWCRSSTTINGWHASGEVGIDDLVVEAMWEHLERVEFEGLDEGLALTEDEGELEALLARRERDAQDSELEAALGHAGWLKHLAALTVQVGEVQARLEEKLRRLGRPDGRPVAELRQKWESGEMTMDEKRMHLASVIQMVFVRPGKGQPARGPLRRSRLAERMHIIWANEPEFTDIPWQGKVGFIARPFPFPDTDPDVAGVVPLQPEVEHAGGAVG